MISPYLILCLLVACVTLDRLPWTPSIIKRAISSWQGLAAGAVALGVYLELPAYIRRIDPTAGVFDAGFLQWIGLGTVIFFFGIFVTWLGWQIAFRSVDRAADKSLDAWFADFQPRHRWLLTQATFALMLFFYLLCLWAVPIK